MRTVHRISVGSSLKVQHELRELGVSVSPEGLATFKIDESDPRWPTIRDWAHRRQALDVVSAVFSNREVDAANWAELLPAWHCGYPQPRTDQFGFREATYDVSGLCGTCGVGAVQKAPFQMDRAPKWGKRGVCQLHWVFDEFFVTPEVWDEIFRPRGVGRRSVRAVRGGELEDVVQLDVPERRLLVDAEMGAPYEVCPECGVSKFSPEISTWLPPLAEQPSSPMFKTSQWFGSGKSAYNRVVISAEIVKALKSSQVKGCEFRPALPVG